MRTDSPLVTYYHSVAPALFEGWPLRFLTMKLDDFEREMEHIVRRRWRTVFMDEWWSIRCGEVAAGGDALCITFDDGLLDNWVYAFPVVKKHGLKMTLFVCPELIEPGDHVRPNLDDVWSGKCKLEDLQGLGQLSWGELKAMQRSGFADIQSHTMTHTKHIISDKLRGAHYGDFEGYYPALNTYTLEQKPRYMYDPGFSQRIALGTPLFEENSAVVARRKMIDEDFMMAATKLAAEHDLTVAEQRATYEQRLHELYDERRRKGSLVVGEESFQEHVTRVEYEVMESKRVIEEKLGKPVRFLCWPHGGNSMATHAVAKQAGYVATTVGKMRSQIHEHDRIPRIGTGWPLSPRMARFKFDHKVHAHYGRQPHAFFQRLNEMKHQVLTKH